MTRIKRKITDWKLFFFVFSMVYGPRTIVYGLLLEDEGQAGINPSFLIFCGNCNLLFVFSMVYGPRTIFYGLLLEIVFCYLLFVSFTAKCTKKT
jgi:hypothetical protein